MKRNIVITTLMLSMLLLLTSCTNVNKQDDTKTNNIDVVNEEINTDTAKNVKKEIKEEEDTEFNKELKEVDITKVTVYAKFDKANSTSTIYTIGFNDDKIVTDLNIMRTLPLVDIKGYEEFIGKEINDENNKKIEKLMDVDEAVVLDITPNTTGKELPKDYVKKYTKLTILSFSYDEKVKESITLEEFTDKLIKDNFEKIA